MLAWITPDDAPGSEVCYKVWLPSGIDYEACMKGALLSLTEEANWEQVSGQTAGVVAAAFNDAFQETVKWRRCMPVGTVIQGGWSTIPDGFLECNGASYAVASYQALFDAIGYAFGGAGANFSVPDLRKRLPSGVGLGVTLGQYYGQSTAPLAEINMPPHFHQSNAFIGLGSGAGPVGAWLFNPTPFLPSSTVGGGVNHNNVPPSLALTSCISYE